MLKLIYPKFWQRRGIISLLLWPLSQIYYLLGAIRNLTSKQIKLPGKVICVGNINVGGTGKTQVVAWLAKLFTKDNRRFVIITKGYKSELKRAILIDNNHQAIDVGDESVLLRGFGPVIAAKKIRYAYDILKILKPEIIIVDDGMQNPTFYKDLTILTFDNMQGIGNGMLIPSGPLRQYPGSATNIDVVITIGNAQSTQTHKINYDWNKPNFKAKIIPNTKGLNQTSRYLAFSSIGNPEKFNSTLRSLNLKLVGFHIFPDHYNYSMKDITKLEAQATKENATLITTMKDYAKISPSLTHNIYPLEVDLDIYDQQRLINLIYQRVD